MRAILSHRKVFITALTTVFSTAALAQIDVWHIGKGGLDWASQAETQVGALDSDGALQPLELLGERRHELRVQASKRGLALLVELQDAEGRVIPGYAFKDCQAVTVNAVRHAVA